MDEMQDALTQYLDDIKQHPLLTDDEEYALGVRIQSGDSDALNRMVESNLRLVVYFAKKRHETAQGIDLLDLIQEGTFGLMKAAHRFDPTLGNRFSTYAKPWIVTYIARYITENRYSVRIPPHVAEEILPGILRARTRLDESLGRPASALEIAEDLGMLEETVENALTMNRFGAMSLDEPTSEDQDTYLHDIIPDMTVHLGTDHHARMFALQAALMELPDEQRIALSLKFGLDDNEALSFTSIANVMGISVARARRLLRDGLKAMRFTLSADDWFDAESVMLEPDVMA